MAALLRMTVDRGCTAAEAETASRLAAKLKAGRGPTVTIARRFDSPVSLDRHRARSARRRRASSKAPQPGDIHRDPLLPLRSYPKFPPGEPVPPLF
jgi:hypothetical protein